MTNMISFRVTADEFDLFRQLAKADNRTLSAYFKHLAHQDAYKAGARMHATIARQTTVSTTSTVAAPTKPSLAPKHNAGLDALFALDDAHLDDGTNPPPDEA